MNQVMNTTRERYPNIPILPSIGNNDVIEHDQVPCNDEIASFYYSELFDIWFPKNHLPAGFNYDKSRESFMNGGYY